MTAAALSSSSSPPSYHHRLIQMILFSILLLHTSLLLSSTSSSSSSSLSSTWQQKGFILGVEAVATTNGWTVRKKRDISTEIRNRANNKTKQNGGPQCISKDSHINWIKHKFGNISTNGKKCPWEECLNIVDMHEIGVVYSSHQEIEMLDHYKSNDRCLVLENIVQICSNYRPHYHEVFVHFPASYLQSIKRVVIVGGGDSMLLHEVLKYNPSIELVVTLELDQEVVRQSFKYFKSQPFFHDERIQWWFGDAAKSINLLPQDLFGSFDLVLLDLAENVLSNSVTEHLDILGAMSTLLKPTGIMVKNEEYFEKFSEIFQFAIRISINSVPTICSQRYSMGSNYHDFLKPNFNLLRVFNVDTLLYKPLEDVQSHFELITNYWKDDDPKKEECERFIKAEKLISSSSSSSEHGHDDVDDDKEAGAAASAGKGKGKGKVKRERDGKSTAAAAGTTSTTTPAGSTDSNSNVAGILMIIEAEDAQLLFLNLQQLEERIVNSLKTYQNLQFNPHYIMSLPSTSGNEIVIIMDEGYVVVHTWIYYKYCSFDIHLWSRFNELEGVQNALLYAVGNKKKNDDGGGSGGVGVGGTWSQFRIVAGGMKKKTADASSDGGTTTTTSNKQGNEQNDNDNNNNNNDKQKEYLEAYGPPKEIETPEFCKQVEEEKRLIELGEIKRWQLKRPQFTKSLELIVTNLEHALEREYVVAVLCGDRPDGRCDSMDALLHNANMIDMSVLWSCSANGSCRSRGDCETDDQGVTSKGDGGGTVTHTSLCGKEVLPTLQKLADKHASQDKITTIIIDPGAPSSLIRKVRSICLSIKHQRNLLGTKYEFIVPRLDEVRFNMLQICAEELIVEPVKFGRINLGKAGKGFVMEIGILTSGISDINRRLSKASDDIQEIIGGGDGGGGGEVEIGFIEGHYTGWKSDVVTTLDDYDQSDGLEQFVNQKHLAHGSLSQYVLNKDLIEGMDSSNISYYLGEAFSNALSNWKVTEIQYQRFEGTDDKLGLYDGTVIISILREGHAILLYDGIQNINLNLYTYGFNLDHEVIGQYLLDELDEYDVELILWDDYPRGYHRVVSHFIDFDDVDKCHRHGFVCPTFDCNIDGLGLGPAQVQQQGPGGGGKRGYEQHLGDEWEEGYGGGHYEYIDEEEEYMDYGPGE